MYREKSFLCLLGGVGALFLSGCSSSPDSTVTGVCKSCKPYYVRGEWHTPQKHYDYDEVGLASWYGPGFHGKPKPHGEPYDQFEMTAAHKTLPIPTIVKVTNLENGKSTKVLIDDRGPFVYKGRIIDLSVAAAKEIGVYGKGTAQVRVTALAEESDKFANHLKQYRNARCPNGRRWAKIFRDDLAEHSTDLVPTVHKGGDCGFSNHHTKQKLVYNDSSPVKVQPTVNLVPQGVVPSKKVDTLLDERPVKNPKVDTLLADAKKTTPLRPVAYKKIKPVSVQKIELKIKKSARARVKPVRHKR